MCLFREKVEAASKEAAGVLDSDSGVFKHNTLPHNCFQEAEQAGESDVYFILKPTYRLWGGYVCEHLSQCSLHISMSPVTAQSATDLYLIKTFCCTSRSTLMQLRSYSQALMGGVYLLEWRKSGVGCNNLMNCGTENKM